MSQLEFLFDFASPNAYYVYKVLPKILERTGASLNINPVLLGGLFKLTNNQAPFVAFGDVKGKMDYEMLESRRFMDKHGLTAFRFNPNFPMNTVLLMRGLLAARELDVENQYLEVVLTAMWEQEKKMDDPEVVGSVLTAAGLDAGAILAMTQTDDIKNRLKDNTQTAVERGVFGIPTFFVGDEMFFGKERLGQVEELLAS